MKRPTRYKNKKISLSYSYCGEDGRELFFVGRTPDKEFPVFFLDDHGQWQPGRGKINVPYHLPKLLSTPIDFTVFIVEGEKDVETMLKHDLMATTNAGGAANSNAFKGWLKHFENRTVCLLPDNDKPGQTHAEKVKAILEPVCKDIWIFNLPGLPPKGDVSDWLQLPGNNAEKLMKISHVSRPPRQTPPPASHANEFPPELRGDAWEGDVEAVEEEAATAAEWKSFPLHALPAELSAYLEEVGRMLHCDPSWAALASLVTMGGAIGNSRVCRLNDTWLEPAVFWGCLVAEASSMKSSASDLATQPAVNLSDGFAAQNMADAEQYEAAFETWRFNGRFAKSGEGEKDATPPPKKPKCRRVRVEDITVEKLAEMLFDNPKGLILIRDELGGWFSSFTRYKSGGAGGSDLDFWLEVFRARSKTVDRKSGSRPSLHVPKCATSVYGTWQPGAVAGVFTPEFFERGFVARILFAMPPASRRVFVEGGIHPDVKDAYFETFNRLYYIDGPGSVTPGPNSVVTEFSPAGLEAWKAFYEAWSDRQWQTYGEIGYALAKLEAYCARFAMLFALIDFVNGHTAQELIEPIHVERAFHVVEWFAGEAERLYVTVETPNHMRNLSRLATFIRSRHEGIMTPRRLLQSNPKKYRTTEVTTAMLEELVAAKLARIDTTTPGSKGGRPSLRYVITT